MSVYPAWSPPAYQAPPPPAPAPVMAYQHPHSVLLSDPNAFRQFFAANLATLTVNSRPIIQNLSVMAQDFPRWSSIVAQCLEAHIRRVPPTMKLPGFYLLDSICKNIYNPYASVFAPIVTQLFLDTHRVVDPTTQGKMEEMLVTWRTGAPNHRELFGVVPQVAIERSVWGGPSAPTHAPAQTHRASPSHPTKKQVLAELEVTLAQKERALISLPYDQLTLQHVETLKQLRTVVQSTNVSAEDLTAIVNQLRAMTIPTAAVQPSAPPAAPVQYAAPSVPPAFGVEPASFAPTPSPATLPYQNIPLTSIQSALLHSANPLLATPPRSVGTPVHVTGTPVPPAPSASAPILPVGDLDKLFASLTKAGLLGDRSSQTKVAIAPAPPPDPEVEAARQYEKNILAMNIKLTNADIVRQRPPVVPLLYNQLPVQCKQCALRFSDDKAGKKRMEDHLDMHFRQNRRASQNIGRGHSRSWFVGFDDWTHDDGTGETRKTSTAGAAAAAAAERDAKLRAAFVVVPQGEEAKRVQCPICKEVLMSEFLEDDEEWVWKNAIRVQDKIYHATCHADAISATNPLFARLRADEAARSRSGTPEAQAIKSEPGRSPSPAEPRGVKRKADVKEEERTPPLKRVALAL